MEYSRGRTRLGDISNAPGSSSEPGAAAASSLVALESLASKRAPARERESLSTVFFTDAQIMSASSRNGSIPARTPSSSELMPPPPPRPPAARTNVGSAPGGDDGSSSASIVQEKHEGVDPSSSRQLSFSVDSRR
mmetsp:Transcript_6741/g.19962  ORF Transcript_6741/g.19962 Transcript_6741/m.19962 type:complete len:135 (+) Transcript_6741:392-796(+)